VCVVIITLWPVSVVACGEFGHRLVLIVGVSVPRQILLFNHVQMLKTVLVSVL